MVVLFRFFLLTLALSILCSCDTRGVEESIKIHDPQQNAQFLAILKKTGVPYRIGSDGQILYPVSNREAVRKVHRQVFGPIDRSRTGVGVRKEYADALARELDSVGIEYERLDNGDSA